LGVSLSQKKNLLDPDHAKLSLRKQCDILEINRSSIYYEAKPVDPYNLLLMNLIDEKYTRHPSTGIIKMVRYLRDYGHMVNHKRVRRLTRDMGLMAVYPAPKGLSKPHPEHKKYPYLLTNLEIVRPNQVWSTDITYIRLKAGFIYLVAIMDWYSRYVLSWKLSNSLEAGFCIDALHDAILYYGKPEIFNTDQGAQFTSNAFTGTLLANDIKISMDGKGRAFDNIFIERLWRTVKYEEVYLNDYESVPIARKRLKDFFTFYNFERHHQSLDYKKPAEVHFGERLPVDLWTSPSDQPEPFGTCGQAMDNASALPTA
jgi:putative transposase